MTEAIYPRVELADGTILNADAGYANGDLWIWLKDKSNGNKDFLKQTRVFSNPEKTAAISYFATKDLMQEWKGMTALIAVTVVDSLLNIRLRREVNENGNV